jgi:ketosteroid isomerase-like protein
MSSTTATENAALVRSAYEAFSRGDMAAVAATFAPDIKWHANGRSALAGTFESIDGVLAYFGQLHSETDGTFRVEIHDLLSSDGHVVVLGRGIGDRKGKHLEGNYCHVFHMRGGRVTEAWVVNEDPYAQDEFWS